MNAARTLWSSSWRTAAAVVPPGEVTRSRSTIGCSPVSRSIFAEPTTVCTTSSVAVVRGSPRCTPASIMASTTKNRYAGPEPLIAVTASSWYSGTCTTRPTERSSCSASFRWSSSQCVPGAIAAIPSSTSAGVLGMTRTTATPSARRDSISAVVMPAASEMTSCPARISPEISSSSRVMSCGLTTSTSVSARLAASRLETTSTPYLSRSSAARSGRRWVSSRSLVSRPARIRPDASVSPITPAPRIATVIGRILSGRRSALRHQRSQEEGGVGRSFRHAAHQVAVPLVAVRHVHPHPLALGRQAALLVGPDAVQHLVLVGALLPVESGGQRARDVDQRRVVGGHHRVAPAGHQHLQAAHVRPADLGAVLERHRLRLLVRALAQPDARALVGQVAAVGLGAA